MSSRYGGEMDIIGPRKTDAELMAMRQQSQPEVARVKRATSNRERSEREWRESIIAARAAGVPLRTIAEAAGISHVRVLQITRGG